MSHPDYENIGDPKDRVIEEAGEVLKAIGKANRFGLFNYHPFTLMTNIDKIRYEIDDLVDALDKYDQQLAMLQRIHDAGKQSEDKMYVSVDVVEQLTKGIPNETNN